MCSPYPPPFSTPPFCFNKTIACTHRSLTKLVL